MDQTKHGPHEGPEQKVLLCEVFRLPGAFVFFLRRLRRPQKSMQLMALQACDIVGAEGAARDPSGSAMNPGHWRAVVRDQGRHWK